MKLSKHLTAGEIAALPEFARYYNTPAAVVTADLETVDAKGRAIGKVCPIWQVTDEQAPIVGMPAGWYSRTWTTRDGAKFGASPSSSWVGSSLEQALAEVVKRLLRKK